jgi:PAS domain S-box-containing protein
MNNNMTKILIAEDSAVQAETLRRMLVAEGYIVHIARDGVEGLAMAKEIRPELIISDIIMPHKNGFELCRQIKDDPEISATPVILLTSLSDPVDVISGLECGADNFIVKPYDEHQLLSRIRHIQFNRELRQDERTQMGVQISFAGKKYFITSEKKQILDLLISTYESAVQKNIALAEVQEELEKLNEELEQRVRERTAELTLEIEERKNAQERLLLANTVIENSPTMLFRWKSAEGWPVEYVSENVSQFGYTAADLLSGAVTFLDIVHPEDLARVAEEVEHYSNAGVQRFSKEYRIVTAAGDVRTIDDQTTVERDGAGVITHYQGIVTDITERKRLESQLRQSQKMEAIGTLAGGIAHDFNNILTAILGFGEIVMEQLEPDNPLREDQEQVLKAGQRAKDLVKQILTFSRRTEQELQPLLLQFVVKEALKLLRASIPTSIELREEIDVNCGLVMADPGQIHQVLMNLCTNAYQAMRETGGMLTVSLKSRAISEVEAVGRGNMPPGNYVVLEVSDNGCGMSRAVRERIFEPYYTTKAKGEGTGLGLSLVHGIVTGLAGVINVYSEPGLGTTFKVYLPLIAGEIDSQPELKNEIPPGGDEAILVVDDEEVITNLERKLLEGLGYRVAVFADSEEALQAFRADPEGFDLILTDMTMPRLNGDELAREILRIRPGMPIILCTGFSEVIDAEKSKGMGIREFMLKPIEKNELARAVRRALDLDISENA